MVIQGVKLSFCLHPNHISFAWRFYQLQWLIILLFTWYFRRGSLFFPCGHEFYILSVRYKEYSPLVFWYDFYCLMSSDQQKKITRFTEWYFLCLSERVRQYKSYQKTKGVYSLYFISEILLLFPKIIKTYGL